MLKKINNYVRRPKSLIIILLFFLLFSGMRLVFINADAPQDLTISAAIYTDEGFKTYAARNFVLFGNWTWTSADEYENWAERNPISTWLYVHTFNIFGINFFSVRIVSILFSILTMILLYFYCKRYWGDTCAYFALLLYGTNFFIIMFNRLGLFETHLNFYIMVILFAVTEMFKRIKSKHFFMSLLFATGTILALAGAFYTKRSFLIILAGLFPGFCLYILNKRGISQIGLNRFLIIFLILFGIMYFIVAHFIDLQAILASIQVFGKPLALFIPVKNFDTLPALIGKGLYLEYIFLHPFTFSIAVISSIFTFYKYIFSNEKKTLELFLSSWFIFGFIILTIMNYHPARYYLLLVIPQIILVSTAFKTGDTDDIVQFVKEKQSFPFNIMKAILPITMLLYSGIILYIYLVPFTIRGKLMRIVYSAVLNNDIGSVLYILIPVSLFVITTMIVLFLKRNSIKELLLNKNSGSIFLALILGFQIFHYGKWFFFHDNNLYRLNSELEEKLPDNAVLAGSWASGFSIGNSARPLVIQEKWLYNRKNIHSIIRGNEFPSYILNNKGISKSITQQNIPIYFTLSKNVVFEKTIVKEFKKYLLPHNLITKTELGYFDVEIYKIDHIAAKENLTIKGR